MLKHRPIFLQCTEMLVLFAALVAVDRGLLQGNAFSGLNPNPYWLPVLAMAIAYGTGMGLVAGIIASAIWLNWSDIGPAPVDHLEQQLRLSVQPMLWMVAALVIGEVTASRMNRIADQERHHEAMDRNWKRLAEVIAHLTDTNRKLQVRIATEQRTVVQAVDAGLKLMEGDPEGRAEAIARMIALAAQTEDFTFYDVSGRQMIARFSGRAAADPPPELTRSLLAEAMLATPRSFQHDCAADQAMLAEIGIVALPVLDRDDALAAVIVIHSIIGARTTEAYMAQLRQIADLLGGTAGLFAREQEAMPKWLVPQGKVA
ncbi:hypothetical protein [Sphingobium sp. Sx8-8]|uniref:hypothetical protein n=1 Tax=Sphingobium sp. Sx8-8 TaxID=2933617 RepID=UPI001F57BB81|nr:hypothetical protein [Sphingobium sp. Sx8-8]